jgi:hypothetical protein
VKLNPEKCLRGAAWLVAGIHHFPVGHRAQPRKSCSPRPDGPDLRP